MTDHHRSIARTRIRMSPTRRKGPRNAGTPAQRHCPCAAMPRVAADTLAAVNDFSPSAVLPAPAIGPVAQVADAVSCSGTLSRVLVSALAALALLGAAALPASGNSNVPLPSISGAAAQPGPLGRLFGTEIRRLPTKEHVIALTFNAAWDDTGLATVLKVLHQRKAPATFFLTGQFAERHPQAARSMATAGHGIANHSYDHPSFGALPRQEREREVQQADRAIRRATRTVPLPFFRFPYSATTPQGIADVNALGFADIEFTADTNGYIGTAGGMTVHKALARAMDALVPGEIVQLHVGAYRGRPPLDAQALPQIIDALRARGYRITDLRTLLTHSRTEGLRGIRPA